MAELTPFTALQWFDDSGDPLASGTLTFYQPGTTTFKNVYTNADGDVVLANPVSLDSAGRAAPWLGDGAYKVVVKNSAGTVIKTIDNLSAGGAGSWRSVDTISDLRSNNSAAADFIHVGGHTTVNDGGDGVFFWNATSSASDNNGTIILPNSNPATGRWIRVYSGPVNVKWFGVNGAADATAFTNAISALPAAGGSLLMPRGAYVLAANLPLGSATKPVQIIKEENAYFTSASAFTVTFYTPPQAGPSQFFAGSITAVFSGKKPIVFPQWWGSVAAGSDDYTKIAAAIATGCDVEVPPGDYLISDHLLPLDNQKITLTPDTTITQTTENKNIFRIVQKSNVWIHFNGATIWGEGTYEGAFLEDGVTANPDKWTGNDGHDDRGIQILGASNCGITNPVIKRCGHTGIHIQGGSDILIENPHIEGTNTHGTPIQSQDNYQMGIFLQNDATYGVVENIQIVNARVSGTAQGILSEDRGLNGYGVVFTSPIIHDITGQHGFYLQDGRFTINNPHVYNIRLAGIKVQSQETASLRGFVITDANIHGAQSQGFEIANLGTGDLADFRISGVCRNVGRGMGISGAVKRGMIDLVVMDATAEGFSASNSVSGGGLEDLDVRVKVKTCAKDGVYITTSDTKRVRIWPTVHNPGGEADVTYSGVRITSISAEVDIFDPNILIDSGVTNKPYAGIFVENAGSTVGIYGSVTVTGPKTFGVRALAVALRAFPVSYTISSGGIDGTEFSGKSNALDNISLDRIVTMPALTAGSLLGLDANNKIVTPSEWKYSDTNHIISANTDDASDNKRVRLAGGGAATVDRGGYIIVAGNEYSGIEGDIRLVAGNTAISGFIRFYTNNGIQAGYIDRDGNLTLLTGALGYATGAGGTIAQATSKSTGVTLNKVCGRITMNNANLATGATASFTFTNSKIAATDLLHLQVQSGGTAGAYMLNSKAAAGSATIEVTNRSAGDLAEAIVIAFAVIKGVTA